jgi:hypothetical protein
MSALRARSWNVLRIALGVIRFRSLIASAASLNGLSSADGARKPPASDGSSSSESRIGPGGSRSTCHRRIAVRSSGQGHPVTRLLLRRFHHLVTAGVRPPDEHHALALKHVRLGSLPPERPEARRPQAGREPERHHSEVLRIEAPDRAEEQRHLLKPPQTPRCDGSIAAGATAGTNAGGIGGGAAGRGGRRLMILSAGC